MYDCIIGCKRLSNKNVIRKPFVKDLIIDPKGMDLKGLNWGWLEAPIEKIITQILTNFKLRYCQGRG